jgi:hypothetical protein
MLYTTCIKLPSFVILRSLSSPFLPSFGVHHHLSHIYCLQFTNLCIISLYKELPLSVHSFSKLMGHSILQNLMYLSENTKSLKTLSNIDIYTYIVNCRGYEWLIITGSGLDDWIYCHFYYNYSQLQSTITNYNWWLPKTHSIPSWTMSVFSSTVTDLHEWHLSCECLLLMNYISFYNLVWTEDTTLPWTVRLL